MYVYLDESGDSGVKFRRGDDQYLRLFGRKLRVGRYPNTTPGGPPR